MIAKTTDISTVVGNSRYAVRGTTRDNEGCRYLIVDDTVEQITLHWLIEDYTSGDKPEYETVTISGKPYSLYMADNGDCKLESINHAA